MFCCFSFLKRSETHKRSDEKKPIVTINEPTKIRYQTLLHIPYAHVLRDDKIPIESSWDISETKTPAAYLLLSGEISNQDYETACFSLDGTNVSTPVVFATRTTTSHILLERLYKIEHVTAINSSDTPIHSSTICPARPFDEFATDSTTTNNPPDVQCDNR